MTKSLRIWKQDMWALENHLQNHILKKVVSITKIIIIIFIKSLYP